MCSQIKYPTFIILLLISFYFNLQSDVFARSFPTWRERGAFFSWNSTLTENNHKQLDIFWICEGNPSKPNVLFIHGFPTSSIDFEEVFSELGRDFYLCALDTPGYGYSDKPQSNFTYSIFDDASLVDYFIREVATLSSFILVTHDKGDTVGLELLKRYNEQTHRRYTVDHHILTNGNVYLPLASLSDIQLQLLDPVTGPVVAETLTPLSWASAIGLSLFSPPLLPVDVFKLAKTFSHQDGTSVLDDTIKYLNERADNEIDWLEALKESDVPATLAWGTDDSVAPVEVSYFVWDNYLRARQSPSDYWQVPCSNHYLQNDKPSVLAELIRAAALKRPAQFSGLLCRPKKIE